jgi:hypothetical protein
MSASACRDVRVPAVFLGLENPPAVRLLLDAQREVRTPTNTHLGAQRETAWTISCVHSHFFCLIACVRP